MPWLGEPVISDASRLETCRSLVVTQDPLEAYICNSIVAQAWRTVDPSDVSPDAAYLSYMSQTVHHKYKQCVA